MQSSIQPSRLIRALVAACALTAISAQAGVTLSPLVAGTAPAGASVGGLAGSWYQVDNTAHFSTASYTDELGTTGAIGSFSWGTGIWAATDIASIVSGQNPYVTKTATSAGAVSYANNIYNNTQASGAFGSWGEDYQRALAPIVGGTNSCVLQPEAQALAECGTEFNYAAVFSGYLYVSVTGTYDFGVFADDGFLFQLAGVNGSLGMAQNTVSGSTGRNLYELVSENNIGSLTLEQGYYGIDLSYFNRLEAGVIDLGWRGPGATAWTSINDDALFHVPEPTSLALSLLSLVGLWSARRHRTLAAGRAL